MSLNCQVLNPDGVALSTQQKDFGGLQMQLWRLQPPRPVGWQSRLLCTSQDLFSLTPCASACLATAGPAQDCKFKLANTYIRLGLLDQNLHNLHCC